MDVSEISKKFGGGGHRKAAGFTLPKSKHPDSIFEVDESSEESILTDGEYGAD